MRLAPRSRIGRLGVAGVIALAFAGSALAYVCHPDRPGTRSLAVHGRVDAYAMTGSRVAIDFWANGCERRISWNPVALTISTARCTTRGVGNGGSKTAARDGRLLAVLERGSAVTDRPDRLGVYDARTGARLHDWPLPARAETVDVARGIALLSTSHGVYALRLRDGQFALVGVKRRGDYPQIEAPGIVFQDDLYKGTEGAARATMKFVPFAAVSHDLRPAGPLRVPARIGSFSLDGRSVIFVRRDPTGRCDRIGLWTIPWHYTTELMDEPPICPERHARGGITALALGGQYFEVVTTYGNVQTLISSTIVECIERVVARTRLRAAGAGGTAIRAVAGDGELNAYALGPQGTAEGAGRVGFLLGQQPTAVADSSSAPVQLSADHGRVAVLRADGRVDLLEAGRLLQAFEPAAARAVALRADTLAVLTRRNTLDVFSLRSGGLVHSWPVPAGTRPALDVHFGVAVFTAGGRLFALRLTTGRTAVLVSAPRAVAAQIDDVGVVYRYNLRRSGFLGFLPFAAVERALG